jgi:hypothetical protein
MFRALHAVKALLIEIVGHQTIPDPALHLTLQIANSKFTFDVDSPIQTWQWPYDDSVIRHHSAAISLHNKRHLIDQSEQDLSTLCYVIDSISFDGKDVADILQTCAQYRHCTNGFSTEILEPYTNWLGHDGSLEFQIITPVFCWWLLDYKF